MPEYYSKNIYVKPEDLELFEEAAQTGESLSAVVADALREYLRKKRKEQKK